MVAFSFKLYKNSCNVHDLLLHFDKFRQCSVSDENACADSVESVG